MIRVAAMPSPATRPKIPSRNVLPIIARTERMTAPINPLKNPAFPPFHTPPPAISPATSPATSGPITGTKPRLTIRTNPTATASQNEPSFLELIYQVIVWKK
jgi:hypothetical protein